MRASRAFRAGLITVAAAGSGVGVAMAAAGDGPVLRADVTFPSRDLATRTFGSVEQNATTYPTAAFWTWGSRTVTEQVLCPADRTGACTLVGTYQFPPVTDASGIDAGTATHRVVYTTPTGEIMRAATAPIAVVAHADATIDEAAVAFGAVPATSTSPSRRLTVRNGAQADGALTLRRARIEGPFALTGTTCGSVPAGGTCTIDIVARPLGEGPFAGSMSFDLGDRTDVEVALTGTGTAAPPPFERIVTAPAAPPVVVTAPPATVTVRVTPSAARCVVPKLKGRTLSSARRALKQARCALGTVRKPKRGRSLVVAAQTVRAGTRRTAGTKVGVRLAPKPRRARRR
jgi:hypothetical protein